MDGGNRVLLIGFDPNAIPGVDAALVETAIAFNTTGENSLEAVLRWLPSPPAPA